MPELTRASFERVLHLLPRGSGMARAVLEGRARGRVWADDTAQPTRALVGTVELWFLLGPPGDGAFEGELARVFEEIVLPGGSILADDTELLLTHDAPEQNERLSDLLGGRHLANDPRRYLELAPDDLRPAEVPPGYVVQVVDGAFLDSADGESARSIRHWIESHYLERNDFLERSTATVLMFDGVPASWCVTDCFGADGVAEVGIETASEHRRRGLAAAAVARTSRWLFARGAQRIGWHCYIRNEGSKRTAARVGFHAVRDYPGRFRLFDARRHELVHGWCLLEIENDAAAALAQLRPELEMSGVEASWFVVAARAAARLDDLDDAFAFLNAAREREPEVTSELDSDDDFAALRADPRWPTR